MDADVPSIDRVAVVGVGRMGHGIALTYAAAGLEVTVFDADEAVLASSLDRIRAGAETLARHGRLGDRSVDAVTDAVEPSPSIASAVADVGLVTEAVAEDLELKRTVFEDLAAHAPEDAVLATNTSGLSVTDIASATDRPARVVGTHWFNPPYVVPLVEVVKGEDTADRTAATARDLLDAAGKTPVLVEEDIPGFVANRIQTAMAYEAFSLLERGVASAEAIDTAVKAGFGFRLPVMGIFEKIDQSGLAVHREVERELLPHLDRGTEPSATVTRLVEAGHTGLESGRGVYDWTDVDPDAVIARRDDALLGMLDLYERTSEPGPAGDDAA